MLDTLPLVDGNVARSVLSSASRRAVTMILLAIGQCQIDRIALVTLAWTLGLGWSALAVLTTAWVPLLGILSALLLLVAGRWLHTSRFQRLKIQINKVRAHEGFRSQELLEFAAELDWDHIGDKVRGRFLDWLAALSFGAGATFGRLPEGPTPEQ